TETPRPSASSSPTRPPRPTSRDPGAHVAPTHSAAVPGGGPPARAVVTVLPHLVNGVALGILFGVLALGFMLIVGVMEVINLAHGSLFALGAYVAMEIVTPRWMGRAGATFMELPLAARYGLALVVAPVLVGLLGAALERCVRRTYGKKAEYGLLLTFGAGLVLEEAIRIVWGPGEQSLPVPEAVNGGFVVGAIVYSKYRFFAAGLGVVLTGLVWLLLERTPYGARVKAGAH